MMAGDAPARSRLNLHVVATGFGDQDTGGGAFVVGADRCERLDWLASTGLAVEPSGHRLARLVRGAATDALSSELLIYDARGVLTYRRVDELADPHDVVWHGDGLVVAATSANRLLWLDDAGRVVDRWVAPGSGDAWHLNCLLEDGDRLLACAFGRFATHRARAVPEASEASGLVFDVATGETVLDGFGARIILVAR